MSSVVVGAVSGVAASGVARCVPMELRDVHDAAVLASVAAAARAQMEPLASAHASAAQKMCSPAPSLESERREIDEIGALDEAYEAPSPTGLTKSAPGRLRREIGARLREVSSPGPPAQLHSSSSPQALLVPSPHPRQASGTASRTALGPQSEVWGASELHRHVDARLRLMRWLMGAGLDEPEIQASSDELERARISSVDELHGRWMAVAPRLPPAARSKLGARVELAAWLRDAL